MNSEFKMDYYRMTGTEYHPGLKSLIQCLFSHQIRYMRLWRKAKASRNPLYRVRLKHYAMKYGIEISSQAEIGHGLYLGHPYCITVGNAKLGNNVNLHKGCTIGTENRGHRLGAPVIGNNVSVGINATVIGNITIGNDVMIAPGSLVNFDVPDHSVVIGNPGVIHHKENATHGYVCFTV